MVPQTSDLIMKCKYFFFQKGQCVFQISKKSIPNNYPDHNPPEEKIAQDRDLEYIFGDLKNTLYFLKKVIFSYYRDSLFKGMYSF